MSGTVKDRPSVFTTAGMYGGSANRVASYSTASANVADSESATTAGRFAVPDVPYHFTDSSVGYADAEESIPADSPNPIRRTAVVEASRSFIIS